MGWGGCRESLHTAALCKGAAATQQMPIVATLSDRPRVARSPDFFKEKPEIWVSFGTSPFLTFGN